MTEKEIHISFSLRVKMEKKWGEKSEHFVKLNDLYYLELHIIHVFIPSINFSEVTKISHLLLCLLLFSYNTALCDVTKEH